MKKLLIIIFFVFIGTNVFSQEKVKKLKYARTKIKVPELCNAKSEYEIFDCNGFSAQWLFLQDEMVEQNLHKVFFSQFEQQVDYKSKIEIKFKSQNRPFEGYEYELTNGEFKIIGFGKVDDLFLVINLGFKEKPKNNNDLTEFEKNFIVFN